MKTYSATYMRVETKVITITCKANNEEDADDIFTEMVSESIQGNREDIDWDAMECVDAEDHIQDIEEVKE